MHAPVGGFVLGSEEETDMGKKIDIAALKPVVGTLYPPPFDEPCRLRERTRLGDAARLTQYGVNLMRLPPGAWSSQRHWHAKEDEFIYVLSGAGMNVTLIGRGGSKPGGRSSGRGRCCINSWGRSAHTIFSETRM
jgi:hypothetical protein